MREVEVDSTSRRWSVVWATKEGEIIKEPQDTYIIAVDRMIELHMTGFKGARIKDSANRLDDFRHPRAL